MVQQPMLLSNKYNHFLRLLLWPNQFYINKQKSHIKGRTFSQHLQPKMAQRENDLDQAKTKQKYIQQLTKPIQQLINYIQHSYKPFDSSYTPYITLYIVSINIEQPSKLIHQLINTSNREKYRRKKIHPATPQNTSSRWDKHP